MVGGRIQVGVFGHRHTVGAAIGGGHLLFAVSIAGISTAKSLLSKKAKLIKVVVKAGYKVLLKDKNVQQ